MLGLGTVGRRIFGSSNDRKLKKFKSLVDDINALEPDMEALSDDALAARTAEFRKAYQDGTSLDDLLVPAFATVREASKRTLGLRPFDVQLIGAIVLHKGAISEMKTGEGKTLVATLAAYLNAIADQGVHIITVNDYLASRDAEWMGAIYNFLGLTVGTIVHGKNDAERKAAYGCDITFGTNNEFGFDYLRDNMKYSLDSMVQRGHAYAIVDEVDSILIDEARTPLIISGPVDDHSDLYLTANEIIPQLDDDDYEHDEKSRQVTITEQGNEHLDQILSERGLIEPDTLYAAENVSLVHHINQALRAHIQFTKDRDYVVRNDKVVIIDEFTGRMMEGRRYSEGLHQALEAKEGVEIQPENQTLASITFQNYFRMYKKLAGMTGTAATEAGEFDTIYGLEVYEIPTNVDVARIDDDDEVYRTAREKYEAIIELIEECRKTGQPVLVGTTTIEKSETLSELLKKRKIKHNVLNARYHEQEAEIIAQAGVSGAVTIATNMAGRGTDIQLGGNLDMRLKAELGEEPDEQKRQKLAEKISAEIAADKQKVLDAGGLYVIGTERHESRRIDNQLRGRSGRQGDPGHSKFFLSLEDDLMRIFGSERMDGMLRRLGLEEGEAIIHPWINKAIEKAQEKVEARNFDIRKNVLKYDDVMNDQRKVIFDQRIEFMRTEDVSDDVTAMRHDTIANMVKTHIPPKAYPEQWDTAGLKEEIGEKFAMELPVDEWAEEEGIADEEVLDRLTKTSDKAMAEKAARFGPSTLRQIEKGILLQTLDHHWREHLLMLEHLRQVIGLRGYGQRDPLNEYKTESFALFSALLDKVGEEVTSNLMRVEVQMEQPGELAPPEDIQATHIDPQTGENEMAPDFPAPREPKSVNVRTGPVAIDPDDPSTWGKVPRNALCPCGSGKKYKHCHGRAVA